MEGRATLKAIVVSKHGGPEVLIWTDIETPSPGPSEVQVEVEAAGVNFIDIYQRTGLYQRPLPFVIGLEGSGRITALGENVSDVGVGDRVAWPQTGGSYAQQVVVPRDRLIVVPPEIDSKTPAAVMLQGLTAHYLATSTYPLTSDDLCLIHAGAGGVGLLLTQIAKIKGATVVTTVGTEEKAEMSRGAGSDYAIVYTNEDFVSAVESRFGPKPMSVVYDGVGAATFEGGLEVLRPRGMMVTFGNASGPVPKISPLVLGAKGSLFLTRPSLGHHIATQHELETRSEELFGWIGSGRIEVTVSAEFAMEDAADAHRALESRATTGKLLLCR